MSEGTDRDSYILSDEVIETDPDTVARIEAENAVRQFDAVTALISGSLAEERPFRLRASHILELNRLAVTGLQRSAGTFRALEVGIGSSAHQPPPYAQVPRLVEDLCDYVESSWAESPIHLAAYVLWRINWIHPFIDGNGRTARAVSYLILSIRLGWLLPGTNTIPEQIALNKSPYYEALEAADAAFAAGAMAVTKLEEYLADLLAKQLIALHDVATRGESD